MMPPHLRGNFQDLPAWRQAVFEVLDLVLGRHDGDVIVPMTITELAGLTLAPGTSGALRTRARQAWITLKHIRHV